MTETNLTTEEIATLRVAADQLRTAGYRLGDVWCERYITEITDAFIHQVGQHVNPVAVLNTDGFVECEHLGYLGIEDGDLMCEVFQDTPQTRDLRDKVQKVAAELGINVEDIAATHQKYSAFRAGHEPLLPH